MRFAILIPIVYAAALAETSLGDLIAIGPVGPDLLALVAVVWLLAAGGPRGFLVAGAIGLVGDLAAPGRIGPGMACFLLVGYAVARLRHRLPPEHLAAQVAVVWTAVTLIALGLGLARLAGGEVTVGLTALLTRAAGVGLYTAGVALPVLMVLGWVREPLLARRRKLLEY